MCRKIEKNNIKKLLNGGNIVESIKLSFEAVMPIFILMSLGYILKKIKLADKKSVDVVNGWVFKIFLPVLLF